MEGGEKQVYKCAGDPRPALGRNGHKMKKGRPDFEKLGLAFFL